MPEPTLPKALAFDVFGTVVDWRTSVTRESAVFLERIGQDPGTAAAFADAWRRQYIAAMIGMKKSGRPFVPLDVLHREILDGLLPRFGLGALTDAERAELNRVWHRLAAWPDSVAGLTRLKARFTICSLSNGNIGLLTNMARRAGLPWDCVLSAEVFRAYKPDPATYLGVASTFDLSPAQVMVGPAHPDARAAARACGLATAYIERPLEFGAAHLKDVSPDPANTWHARSLVDLADQLGC